MKVTLGWHPEMKELDTLSGVYRTLGVDVAVVQCVSADAVFHRDVVAWTPYGLIKAKMTKPNREWEPGVWFSMMALEPAMEVSFMGKFEAADLLWAGDKAILAQGDRTNRYGVMQVQKFLEHFGTEVIKVDLPDWHDQHLLGVMNYYNGELFVHPDFKLDGFPLPTTPLTKEFKATNFVVVDDTIITSVQCPESLQILSEKAKVIALDFRHVHHHGGGIGCASGIYDMSRKEVAAKMNLNV